MDEELLEIRQELLKTLFIVSEAGKLEEYIRHAARMHTRLAVRKGEVEGNVIHAAPIFNFCSYVREIAWRALPDGRAMNLTRPQLEAAWGGPQDWHRFSGMKKREEDAWETS
jgi:hypothetical protein